MSERMFRPWWVVVDAIPPVIRVTCGGCGFQVHFTSPVDERLVYAEAALHSTCGYRFLAWRKLLPWGGDRLL